MGNRKIHWYDLGDNGSLYIDSENIISLISQGINKSGSLSKLCQKINSGQLYNIVKYNRGITVKTLKRLLDYIGTSYDAWNGKIMQIRKGTVASIINPKFPIDLSNYRMGYLIGHLMSDGCLYYDKSRKNLIRTKYCSDNRKAIDRFLSNIVDVFGEVHYNEEFIRNCIQLKIGNGFIGDTFRKSGVTVGKKFEIDSSLPWVILEGDTLIKKAYLSAIFDDEGSVGIKPAPYIILSRNIHIDLTPAEESILSRISHLMTIDYFPTGHYTKRLAIRKLKNALVDTPLFINKILNSKPRLLLEESKLLKELGINNKTYVMSLQITTNGNISIQSSLVISRKEDVVKFYKEIGFSCYLKQNKLGEALKQRGRIANVESVQHLNEEQGIIQAI